jgi:3-deoxy-D-manno-octulosonate 8-phosphate phosphatase (KDO 8-P phosphatase)
MPEFAANRSWTPELDRKARALEWLLLDVDGVLTDGRLHLGREGEVYKSFHVRDGLAIQLARRAGLKVGILSARESEIVALRGVELGIEELLLGRRDKGEAFRELLARRGVTPAACGYVGDDLQDLGVLAAVGFSAAPADAAPEVRRRVDFVTAAGGGAGCVRELVERLLTARAAWGAVVEGYGGGQRPDADGG